MKVAELRKKESTELQKELIALLKERFNMRIAKTKLQDLKKVRLNIARIKTILHEKGVKV